MAGVRSPTAKLSPEELKQEAIRQWTSDPCGSIDDSDEPGTRGYVEKLLAMRHDYAPWMADELGYDQTAGLDVLDVGCGQGIDLIRYAQAGARVTGIDLTPRHADLARSHLAALGLEGTVVNGDAESLPFDDASFDRASSNGVLHHTPGIEPALAEIARVLRPGGEARIILYHRRSAHYFVQQYLWRGLVRGRLRELGSMGAVLSEGVERGGDGARPLVNVYSRGELGEMLGRAGLEATDVRVRHFRPSDTVITGYLARRGFTPSRLYERLGRRAGWYVIGIGRKP